jgi:solute carrier family 12 sodium/potassium/chloride transporter 2
MIRHFYHARRNVMIVRADDENGFGRKKNIDVWWGGLNKNGGLMMLLAYLLRNSINWQNAEVTVKMVVSDEKAAQKAHQNLDMIVKSMRVNFKQQVIEGHDRAFWDILREESREADLLMMGLAEPGENFLNYYENLNARTSGLPATVYVLAAQEIDFKDVLL